MRDDPIVEEVRRIREEYAKQFDYDLCAMAVDLRSERVVDPFGGQSDLRKRRVRCVGEAAERFVRETAPRPAPESPPAAAPEPAEAQS